MTRLWAITFLIAVPAVTAAGDPSPSITQMLSLKWPRSASLSPDGRLVVCELQRTNWDVNAFETELWLSVAAGYRHTPLTTGKGSSRNARWSPDGKRIAFISDRTGKPQVYVIPHDGGEATAVTDHETGVIRAEWSPDGRWLAFTSPDPDSKTRQREREKFGSVEVFEATPRMMHLWRVATPDELPATPAAAERLTGGDEFAVISSPTSAYAGFSWSPDGGRIAFAAARSPAARDAGTLDVRVLNVARKAIDKLVTRAGIDHAPVWSPDGKFVAFETSDGRDDFMLHNLAVAVVPADGGEPRVVTPPLGSSATLHAWGPDGIYYSALTGTEHFLYRLDPSGKPPVAVGRPNCHIGYFGAMAHSFASDFGRAAFVRAGPGEFPEVCITNMDDAKPKKLSGLGAQVRGVRLGNRQVVRWKSTDGTPVEGILTTPPDYDAAKKHPLLVVIHGGPAWVDTPSLPQPFAYPLEQFVAKGALILQPNYRGSIGYGEKFRSLNVRNLGIGDAEDVVSGVDELIGQGVVDREKVGVMGWSQGGFISAFAACSGSRFKAASVGAGVSDWTTYYCNSDLQPFTRQFLKATPWDDPEIYRKTSPLAYLDKARTPTLIQHGDLDERVPVANAFALYRGLKDRDVPVKLVLFKGHDHVIFKPKEQRALMEQNLEWFSEHLWGEKP